MLKRCIGLFTAVFLIMSSFTAYAVEWHQDALGWKLWDKSKKPLTSEWYYDSGYQYYLKEDSYRATGWTLIDNSWYYFDQKGHLATDKWIDDKYVDYSGKMLTDTRTPDGYYVGADGKWVENYQGSSVTAGVDTTAASGTGASGFNTAAMYSYAGSSYIPMQPIEIQYMKAHMTKDGGISPNIYFINSSGKIINAIVFTVTPYDARHNVATCEITGNSTVEQSVTGPFYPDDPYSLGQYILGEDGNVHKTSLVTVSDNARTFNNFVLLDHLWLSKTVSTYAIVGIKLQYADGTWETVEPNSVIKQA
ncbi:hypothetical protein SAMN05216349_10163 [Oribacterium sp. KHPX15]|uniref:hypothetical protein n=1 Tax=Oribacterium sp. KHPX15 TaxID=1855342 RepID=UPI00089B66E3|nr:hypothetical protein [Oribacterium sp. KHPX15]SDZ79066.1 hypothetical protein SAMN05216349_10163 [Oribacterium sp. KHPX15]